MSSLTTTSLLLPGYTGNFVVGVIGVDPTATTFLLDCDFENDPEDCGLTSVTIVVGPWADKTVAPGAPTTGIYHEYQAVEEEEWTFSVRCEMSKTYAETCTTVNLNGNDNGYPTATLTHTDSSLGDNDVFEYHGYGSFTWVPVTITAGQALLSNTQMSSAEATSTNSTSAQATSTVGNESAQISKTTGSVTETARNAISSTNAATPVQTSGGGAPSVRALTALFVVAIVSLIASS